MLDWSSTAAGSEGKRICRVTYRVCNEWVQVHQHQQQHPAVTIHGIIHTKQSVVMHHQSQSTHAALPCCSSAPAAAVENKFFADIQPPSFAPCRLCRRRKISIYRDGLFAFFFRAKGYVKRAGFRRRFLALRLTVGDAWARHRCEITHDVLAMLSIHTTWRSKIKWHNDENQCHLKPAFSDCSFIVDFWAGRMNTNQS